MRILRPTGLLSVVALAIGLTSAAAYAVPPVAEPGAPPDRAAALPAAEQPLPTLVPPANDDYGSPTSSPAFPSRRRRARWRPPAQTTTRGRSSVSRTRSRSGIKLIDP
jgi:hypothetical protein